jgi:hypothetical protein
MLSHARIAEGHQERLGRREKAVQIGVGES